MSAAHRATAIRHHPTQRSLYASDSRDLDAMAAEIAQLENDPACWRDRNGPQRRQLLRLQLLYDSRISRLPDRIAARRAKAQMLLDEAARLEQMMERCTR